MSKSLKDHSKGTWIPSLGGQPTIGQLQFGALQRIADATEAMAQNHIRLMNDRDMYERWWKQEKASSARLARSNAALRGAIKRMKKARKP